MYAYLFPGQGSQKKGMGEDLFQKYSEYVKEADEILGYSIKELCINDSEERLNQTEYTQPALYVVNALSYLKKVEEDGIIPDYVAGHSLGEYDALFAAGVFDFATGLKLTKKRGELMAQAKNGGMAAILGLTEEQVRKVLLEHEMSGIDLANLTAGGQVVISGMKQDISKAQIVFEEAGAMKYVGLNVSGAFHSRYMEEAKQQFAQYIESFEFSNPNIPVISNVNAKPYDANEIKETMIQQIVSSVRWEESIRYLMKQGEMEFVQVGPGNVITGLVRKIVRQAKPRK